ncbi:MAG: AAA family ATPase [Bacteroidetes bacterium]|nr:AAA family ATPase [Bacteroidota bacterium]
MDLALKQYDSQLGLFTIQDGNEWMKQASEQAIPQKLFSEFWYEGELCILYADTNTGKSILAVQIADSISKGIPIAGFSMDAPAQKAIYFDFELCAKQFEARYSDNYTNHYVFHPNFQRAEINPDADIPAQFRYFEEYLTHSLELAIQATGVKVLIIDNITYLRTETEKAADAMPLMKELKELKLRYDLSMLVLAHTPKRDSLKAFDRNDLSGSKMLMNFCDSSFCIGESTADKSLRYLKQIKARNTEIVYDARNISLCRIEKPGNFLQFAHCGYGKEHEHLRRSEEGVNYLELRVKQIAEENPDWSQRRIAEEIGVSVSTVNRYIKAA